MSGEKQGRYVPLPYVFLCVAVLAGLIVFVRVSVVQTVYVLSDSMYPTLHKGDRALSVTTLVTRGRIKRGDVVTFKDPFGGSDVLVKRVMALPGDRFAVDGGMAVVNGRAQFETYIAEPMRYGIEEYTVPRGYIVVLGDNRNTSDDSHLWGPLAIKNVRGKVLRVLWPMSHVRKL